MSVRGGVVRPRAFKLAAIERLEAGESIVALARELGVSRMVLWEWRRAYEAEGAAGLRGRGRQRRLPEAAPPARGKDTELAADARVAALERTIGRQLLEIDFLEGALRRIEEAKRAANAPGAPASTPRSRR